MAADAPSATRTKRFAAHVPGCRTRDPLAIVCVTSRVSADGMGKRIVAGMASLSIRLGTAAATLTHRLGSRTSNG